MVFRSLTLDRDVDRAILTLAAQLGAPAGAIFRLFLEAGLALLRLGAPHCNPMPTCLPVR
jgi:hypothetical protein